MEAFHVSATSSRIIAILYGFLATVLINTYLPRLAKWGIAPYEMPFDGVQSAFTDWLPKLRDGVLMATAVDEPYVAKEAGCAYRVVASFAPFDFGLAWRIGTNESLVDELDRLILGLQEDGTVSQLSTSLLARCPQLRTMYVDVPRTECDAGLNQQAAITFDQVSECSTFPPLADPAPAAAGGTIEQQGDPAAPEHKQPVLLAAAVHGAQGSSPASAAAVALPQHPGEQQQQQEQQLEQLAQQQGQQQGQAQPPQNPQPPPQLGSQAPSQGAQAAAVQGLPAALAAALAAQQPGLQAQGAPDLLAAATAATTAAVAAHGIVELPQGLPGASSGVGPKYKRGRGRSFFKEQPKGLVCQVPGCERGLHKARAYYRRYKICHYHVELPCMVVEGQAIRFCQQCGRFQLLSDFEGDRRSCRLKLDKHNARRRAAEMEAKTLLELGESDGGWGEGPTARRSGASEASSDAGAAASTLTFTDPAAGLLAGLPGGLALGPPLSRLISDGRHPPRLPQQAQQVQQQQQAQQQQQQQIGGLQMPPLALQLPPPPLGDALQQQLPLSAVLALHSPQGAARQQQQQQQPVPPPPQQLSLPLPLLPQAGELCRNIFQCTLEQLPWNVRQQFEEWAVQQAGKLFP
ncbi:hypothetical protein COHA_005075 [Chlorella ohadii]|uniref:SBP-type domain-containing protein n=1 Tax=Chlorella ohadii TaxID=2649997 RepID=A0AAD5DRN7_9CHLO|nr:hypothetical protein COHA_005075 [Chlorella ohadii]